MKKILLIPMLLLSLNILNAEEVITDDSITKVLPELQVLMLEEMADIKKGMDKILQLIISADYEELAKEATSLQYSYTFTKKITREQVKELQTKLPPKFIELGEENLFLQVED